MLVQVAVLAMRVGQVGLNALQATTKALDLYEQVIEPHTSKQEGVQPPPPDTPQLLPSVHIIWSPLIGALKVASVETQHFSFETDSTSNTKHSMSPDAP